MNFIRELITRSSVLLLIFAPFFQMARADEDPFLNSLLIEQTVTGMQIDLTEELDLSPAQIDLRKWAVYRVPVVRDVIEIPQPKLAEVPAPKGIQLAELMITQSSSKAPTKLCGTGKSVETFPSDFLKGRNITQTGCNRKMTSDGWSEWRSEGDPAGRMIYLEPKKPEFSITNVDLRNFEVSAGDAVRKVQLSNDLGVVIVKFRGDLETKLLNSRSERPQIYSENRELIGNQKLDPNLFYYTVLLNVPTGMQSIEIRNTEGFGSIHLPVLESMTTYIDATDVELRPVRVTVSDSQSSTFLPVFGATVEWIGTAHTSVTAQNGVAELPKVLRTTGYPNYMDVIDPSSGQRHRVLVDADQMEVSVYAFPTQKIASWLAQIEGGVSATSGVVLGSMDRRGALQPQKVSFGVLSASSGTEPETYYFDDDQFLSPTLESRKSTATFLGIELSPGVWTGKISKGSMETSRLLVMQPGILHFLPDATN